MRNVGWAVMSVAMLVVGTTTALLSRGTLAGPPIIDDGGDDGGCWPDSPDADGDGTCDAMDPCRYLYNPSPRACPAPVVDLRFEAGPGRPSALADWAAHLIVWNASSYSTQWTATRPPPTPTVQPASPTTSRAHPRRILRAMPGAWTTQYAVTHRQPIPSRTAVPMEHKGQSRPAGPVRRTKCWRPERTSSAIPRFTTAATSPTTFSTLRAW